jgi:hypothetical protein
MSMQSNITKSTLLALGLVAAATSALAAQERLFDWSGRVDREVRIMMRGNDVWTQDFGSREARRARARVAAALPDQPGFVRVQVLNGRGDVSVIQQPSYRNNYTTVVRIADRSGGADRYRVAAYWQPSGRGRYGIGRGDIDERFGYGGADGLVRWSGAVDNEVEIRIQGRNVDTRTLSGNIVRDVRANLNGRALPRRDLQVSVRERQGRGTVTVVQQPGQWNGYTAVIRVRDRQGGYGYYDFDVVW